MKATEKYMRAKGVERKAPVKHKISVKNVILKGFTYANVICFLWLAGYIDGFESWQPYAIMAFNAVWLFLMALANGWVSFFED